MSTAAAPSLAILSPRKDFWLFFASSFVVFVAWFAAGVLKIDSTFILAAVAVTSNAPHLVSTWTRVYFDKREWRSRPVATVVMPALVILLVFVVTWQSALVSSGLEAGCTALGLPGTTFSMCRDYAAAGPRLLNSVILYWASWHFVAQNWGIMRIYQRKSGEPVTSLALKLERPILLLTVAWCFLHRVYTGPRMLFGTEVFYVALPRAVVDGLLGPLGFLVVVLLVQRWRERREPWAKAAWIRTAFLGCSFVGFFVPFQLITTDDTSAFAAAAAWHGIQYLGIVRHYNRNAWRSGVDQRARAISWLSQPGWQRAALYWMALLATSGAVYGVIWLFNAAGWPTGWNFYTWAGVVWVGLTLSHYWLDGVIWKLRRPEVAARVGIEVSEALPGPSGSK